MWEEAIYGLNSAIIAAGLLESRTESNAPPELRILVRRRGRMVEKLEQKASSLGFLV